MFCLSSAAFAMLWISVLMPNDKYADAAFFLAVDDRVWKMIQRERPSTVIGRRSKPRMIFQESRYPLKLSEEAGSHTATAFASVEAKRFRQVVFRPSMDRPRHSSSARRRASTSSRGTASTVPCSISASRRAAKASHAASRAASASKLATTRSSSRVRSTVGRRRTSDSRASRDVDMAGPREQGSEVRSLPQERSR